MATRFMVKNMKGFYLQREAKNNSGCTGWAVDKKLGLLFDFTSEANYVIDELPGSSAQYTIEVVTGIAGGAEVKEVHDAEVHDFNIKWLNKEGYRLERTVFGLTEIEMINKVFDEAKKHNLPIINAEAKVVETALHKKTEVVEQPLRQVVEKSL